MRDGGAGSGAPADFATADEVLRAIDSLTEANHLRLMKAAQIYVGGSAYADPRELRDEAVTTPYFSACGERGRRWQKDTDFVAFLIMTMRGLASDSRGSAVRRLSVSTRVPASDAREERDILDTIEHASPSVEDVKVEEERAEERRIEEEAMLEKVSELCARDAQIHSIVKGIREGKTAGEVQDESGMSKLEYDTAHRRWRRKAEKLFLGRRKP